MGFFTQIRRGRADTEVYIETTSTPAQQTNFMALTIRPEYLRPFNLRMFSNEFFKLRLALVKVDPNDFQAPRMIRIVGVCNFV